MSEKGWIYVGIPEEITRILDKIVESRKHGFRSRADIVLEGTKHLLTELGEYPAKPRFEHYNIYEDHITIIDNDASKGREWIDIYFRADRPYCERCEETNCEHIKAILEMPDVIKELKEHGWAVTETGKIVRR